jgi:NADH-quinone oxidoreductase subunit M
MNSLLLGLTFLPLVGALVTSLITSRFSKMIAMGFSLVGVLLAAILYIEFDANRSQDFQFVFSYPWISSFNIKFAFGVDGLSFPLVLLTKFMLPIAILASWHEKKWPRAFMSCYLLLDFAMTGTFLTTDIFVFYVFWELMLIPMILMIGVWGSKDRIFASLKFFMYTFAGSIFMLVAIFYMVHLFQQTHQVYSAEISSFYGLTFPTDIFLGLSVQQWIFLAFTFAFAIKVPLFPFHTWLPDAHVQAPTGGSVLLAAVLLKMGTYGLLRFSIPIAPLGFQSFIPPLVILSLVGIIYGAFVAFQQTDMKKLVAYSSVSHLGYVVLGICVTNSLGLTGAVLQMVNHGLSSGALFFLVGVLYEQRHSRNFSDYGGIAAVVPVYAFFLVFVACSSMAVPGLNGFVGEFLILAGTFAKNPYWCGVAVLGVVFGALYLLWMIRNVLFGEITSSENKSLKDINTAQWCALVPMCLLILALGLFPNLLLSKIKNSLENYWAAPQNPTAISLGISKDKKL